MTEPQDKYETLEEIAAKSENISIGLLSGLKRYCQDHPDAIIAAELFRKKELAHITKFGGELGNIPVYQGHYN